MYRGGFEVQASFPAHAFLQVVVVGGFLPKKPMPEDLGSNFSWQIKNASTTDPETDWICLGKSFQMVNVPVFKDRFRFHGFCPRIL